METRMTFAVAMPAINCLPHTQRAVASLKAPESIDFIFLDNGSTDGTQEWAVTQVAPQWLYLRSEVNLGVPASWNLLIRTAFERGHEVVAVLNNDIILAPDTLERLVPWLKEGVDFPTVHAVAVPRAQLGSYPRHHLLDPQPDFCGFLVTRALIDRIGWFDEGYWPAYFEDVDFEQRITHAGLTMGSACDALVVHVGSRAIHEGGVKHRPYFEQNRQRCLSKWGHIPGRT
jgi:GT2 family glycosyltransferase